MIRNFINKLFNLNKENETKEGTVKFFNAKKGFGFITINDSQEEIFVHTTNVVGKIREKNKVTFNIEKGKKGLVATNVRVIK
ncbi:cold shock protein [Winogradskyella psychrotolerans RS-3]|uniref:Cold shock protein n=1 Tax=Winogradskyella psychrotolerans RS-3 TaxID=641526 RepID=S7VLP1_9FLAO|nr:cold shock domain-containing protein [Winogradskyella psychrotolerans]EPR70362.1 cold shock protein [Winogradskyella psychrotolerans RS-3]